VTNNFNFIINERLDLPYTYNETKIVIIPRDPDVFFIYWDISESSIKDLLIRNIKLNFSIRIKNNNSNSNYYYINPTQYSKNWYFDIKYTELNNEELLVDLGVYDNNGQFIVLSTSNIINLPNKFYKNKNYSYWEDYNNSKNLLINNNENNQFLENSEYKFSLSMNSGEFYHYNSNEFYKKRK
jgi:hypothetical protein